MVRIKFEHQKEEDFYLEACDKIRSIHSFSKKPLTERNIRVLSINSTMERFGADIFEKEICDGNR